MDADGIPGELEAEHRQPDAGRRQDEVRGEAPRVGAEAPSRHRKLSQPRHERNPTDGAGQLVQDQKRRQAGDAHNQHQQEGVALPGIGDRLEQPGQSDGVERHIYRVPAGSLEQDAPDGRAQPNSQDPAAPGADRVATDA